MKKEYLDACQQQFGCTFNDFSLLETALTHKSFSKQRNNREEPHNERLEFLGDAVLKLIVSEYLFELYPESDEGKLTKIRAKLVSDHFLGELGLSKDLGSFMRFSYGEDQSGGRIRLSSLANALEALLGACYLDQGYEAAKNVYVRLIEPYGEELFDRQVDYKSELQELMQQYKLELPDYDVLDEVGPDHDKEFIASVKIDLPGESVCFQGQGTTKKAAQQEAAKLALEAVKAKLTTD